MMDLERRAVVAFPPVGEAFWSGMGPVGLLRYREAGRSRIAVAVRVVSPFPAAGEPFLPGAPIPVSAEPPDLPVFAPLAARELVPYKGECDVGFLGTLISARAGGAAQDSASSTPMEVQIGPLQQVLSVPLAGARVDLGETRAAVIGEGEVLLGPRQIEVQRDFQHIDFGEEGATERFHSAGAALRFRYPTVGTRISVSSGFFSVDAALGFEVFVRVDYLDGTVSLPAAPCDSITFDLDKRQVEWVFRAQVLDPSAGQEIERVVVAAFAPEQDEERSRVDAWLPHAVFAHAAGPEHVERGAHPEPLDEADLAMARYSTWDTGHFAATLPIEEVAQIQVELLRKKDRAAVLAAHGLDEYHYCVEERAAMDRLAEAGIGSIADDELEDEDSGEDARAGGSPDKGSPAAREDLIRYRDAYARALAETPFEGRAWTVEEYADLRAALEARNPIKVLEAARLGPAELIGLDQVMEARFEGNEAERRQFDERFEQALSREQALAEREDDFGPAEDEDEEELDEDVDSASDGGGAASGEER